MMKRHVMRSCSIYPLAHVDLRLLPRDIGHRVGYGIGVPRVRARRVDAAVASLRKKHPHGDVAGVAIDVRDRASVPVAVH